jgi:hypothetical protein
MYTLPTPGASVMTDVGLGFRVARATDTFPASTLTAGEPLFTISGGRVLVTRFFGEVTTGIAATDPVLSMTTAPTVGSAVVIASTVDSKSAEIGAFLSVEGDGSAIVLSVAGAILATAVPSSLVVAAGTINLIAGDDQAGAVKWTLYYVPLDMGAYVEAA